MKDELIDFGKLRCPKCNETVEAVTEVDTNFVTQKIITCDAGCGFTVTLNFEKLADTLVKHGHTPERHAALVQALLTSISDRRQ